MNVLLVEILNARETRAARQQALLQEFHCPVVCFTMNIAGPVKTSPLIRRAFDTGLRALEAALAEYTVHSRQTTHEVTGDEAIFCVDADSSLLKAICTSIEEGSPMGRLFDMDVIDTAGKKLERSRERGCLVCGRPGRSCAAGRLHNVAQLQEATQQLITSHFDDTDARLISEQAAKALLEEVHTTPKPGLVDRRNNGSHEDMDLPLFVASADALRPYFARCASIGQATANLPAATAFPLLREAGLAAEEAMFAATDGVNTHKGAIYTMGILCAAMARLWHKGETRPSTDTVLSLCAEIAGAAAEVDLVQGAAETAGMRLYRELGIRGIRGEMADGLPSVSQIALPAFREALACGYSRNDAGAITLLHLIANVQDTNLYHRGGSAGAAFAAGAARILLEQYPFPPCKEIEALDDSFTSRRLSPGGCADLLAATYFLDTLLSS
jgi:holo-ACP synthase/triphosphoribosyl-dephospho-CoA synthase